MDQLILLICPIHTFFFKFVLLELFCIFLKWYEKTQEPKSYIFSHLSTFKHTSLSHCLRSFQHCTSFQETQINLMQASTFTVGQCTAVRFPSQLHNLRINQENLLETAHLCQCDCFVSRYILYMECVLVVFDRKKWNLNFHDDCLHVLDCTVTPLSVLPPAISGWDYYT